MKKKLVICNPSRNKDGNFWRTKAKLCFAAIMFRKGNGFGEGKKNNVGTCCLFYQVQLKIRYMLVYVRIENIGLYEELQRGRWEMNFLRNFDGSVLIF